jgi:hypothetical protein
MKLADYTSMCVSKRSQRLAHAIAEHEGRKVYKAMEVALDDYVARNGIPLPEAKPVKAKQAPMVHAELQF